jgi:hypothetical protein
MRYKGQEQNTPLTLTPNMIGQLVLEASSRDQKIGELAKDLLQAVMEKGLFQEVLGNDGAVPPEKWWEFARRDLRAR